jgi:hypothetical protein
MDEKVLFRLLRLARRGEVTQLLKDHRLPYSGSWDELLTNRVPHAVQSGKVQIAELYDLVRAAEEFGRQRVFLYLPLRESRNGPPSEQRVHEWAIHRGVARRMTTPHLVESVDEPEVVHIASDELPSGRGITIKEIDRRHLRRQIEEDDQQALVVVTYEKTFIRVVNIVRIHSDGLVEFRVGTRGAGPTAQATEERLWSLLRPLLEQEDYEPLSLQDTRRNLFQQRAKLAKRIRFSEMQIRTAGGATLRMKHEEHEADLFDDEFIERTAAEADDSSTCDGEYFTFLKQVKGQPRADVRIDLEGPVNSFAVIGHCTPADYEHALTELRRFGR